MQVDLSRAAGREIDAMIRWGAKNFGLPTARDYYSGLLQILDLIGSAPNLAKDVGRGMRAHPYRSHMIIYRLHEDKVQILHIRHGRSNWRKHL